MQNLKTLFLPLLLCVFGTYSVYGQDAPLLSSDQIARLNDAADLYLADIGAMLRTPRVIAPAAERADPSSMFYRRLSEKDRRQLIDLLSRSRALAGVPGPEQCRFQPGYRAEFVDVQGKMVATLLICFNCSVWAIGREWAELARPADATYGTAQAQRQQLLNLIRPYFASAPKE